MFQLNEAKIFFPKKANGNKMLGRVKNRGERPHLAVSISVLEDTHKLAILIFFARGSPTKRIDHVGEADDVSAGRLS